MSTASHTALLSARSLVPAPTEAGAWIHLLPAAGQPIATQDGRGPYSYAAAEAVITASFSAADRIPVDECHSIDLAAPLGLPAPARGWITAMQARPDGIWAQVEWTDAGRSLVADRAYRGISPVIRHDKDKRISAILRASLVNNPNLRGLTALHQEDSAMALKERLVEILGLDAAAEDAALIDAVSTLTGAGGSDATALNSQMAEIGAVLGASDTTASGILEAARQAAAGRGGEALVALQAELTSVTGRLTALSEATARDKATNFVDGEVRKGRVGVKALRDHYIAMHMQDASRVEKEISALPILGASGTLASPPAANDGEVSLNAAQSDVVRRLGLDPAKYLATLKAERLCGEAA